MSLQNHEEYGPPAGPTEVGMFTDDLENTFIQNFGACAIRLPDDSTKPIDVLLSGTIAEEDAVAEVVVCRRAIAGNPELQQPADERVSYLMQFKRGEDSYTCHVANGRARHVWNGMPALSDGYVYFYRAALNPQVVQWSAAAAQQETNVDPYIWVRRYDKTA